MKLRSLLKKKLTKYPCSYLANTFSCKNNPIDEKLISAKAQYMQDF